MYFSGPNISVNNLLFETREAGFVVTDCLPGESMISFTQGEAGGDIAGLFRND